MSNGRQQAAACFQPREALRPPPAGKCGLNLFAWVDPMMPCVPRSLLLIVLCGPLFLGADGCELRRDSGPQAVKGVLDLSGWDFARGGPVEIVGEYEFYWNQHLAPQDFAAASPPRPSFIQVPGYWNAAPVDGRELPGEGFVTYRLTVLLAKQHPALALEVGDVSTAYRLFVDDRLVAAVGSAGETEQTTTPRQLPVFVEVTPASDRFHLLLQVSNFHHRRGGLWEMVRLGEERQLRGLRERERLGDFFLLGGIFVMALYHLTLFLLRRRFRASLYYGIFCFLVALRLLTTSERYLVDLLSNLPWLLLVKLEYLSFYLAVPVFGLFLNSFFVSLSARLARGCLVVGLAFSAVVILTPVRVFSHTLPVYEIYTLVLAGYAFVHFSLDALRKPQVEAIVFLAGLSILCLALINDILYVERFIQTGFWAPSGLLVFIISQSSMISFRLIKTFNLFETRGNDLRQALQSLKQEMRDRLRVEEALRESEEKYRTILNSIEEGYYEVDLSGNMLFCNDSLCRIIGYARHELIGMNNRQYMPPEAYKRVYETFLRVYNTGEATKAFDWEVITRAGAKRIVEASITLMRDVKGVPVGFRGVVRDITERKKAEEQARLHQQQMMQASKMAALGVLVSGVAHEINNPNNFIMLNAPILQEAWKSAFPVLEEYYRENGDFLMGGMMYSEMREQMPRLLFGVAQGSDRIKQIVANLKNYVRGDTGDLTQSVDINAVIRSSLSLISNIIKNATDCFTVIYGDGLPLVKGNFQRLEQVIINLIQNACQALPERTKGLCVTTIPESAGPGVVITIRDEGSGIRPEDLPHIREPLFTTRQDAGGIGLGLSISSKIIEEHRGSLDVTSELQKGTTVTVTLPAADT